MPTVRDAAKISHNDGWLKCQDRNNFYGDIVQVLIMQNCQYRRRLVRRPSGRYMSASFNKIRIGHSTDEMHQGGS